MIKLIALDLDNTLLEKKTTAFTPAPLPCCRPVYAPKVTVVIATGRLYLSARKYARQIGPECKVLCYNGFNGDRGRRDCPVLQGAASIR